MKIAILTFHRAVNCGAALQAWALKKVVERMGNVAEFPECNNVGELSRWPLDWWGPPTNGLPYFVSIFARIAYNLLSIPHYRLKIRRFARFRRRFIPERKCEAKDFINFYDKVIVGSDQVWQKKLTKENAALFFADNIPAGIQKIAYAASYGDTMLDDDSVNRIVKVVNQFDNVSVREMVIFRQLNGKTNKDIPIVLDPTLLLCATDYCELMKGFKVPPQPYLFAYVLNSYADQIKMIKDVARRLGLKAIIFSMYQNSLLCAPTGLSYSVSPEMFVGYIANAKYIMTSSFHGTALSLIFKKPFVTWNENGGRIDPMSRIGSLLRLVESGDRSIQNSSSIDDIIDLIRRPLGSLENVNKARIESINWLQSCFI